MPEPTPSPLDKATFLEQLLQVMEAKVHWSWPAFTSGLVPRHLHHIHLEQDWAVFVRDFPVLVGRAYVKCPIPSVRQALAENLYEEETGGIAAGRPHPELFLELPRGLGYDLARFEAVELLPGAAVYRAVLDDCTLHRGWEEANAVTTLFIEGTPWERGELDKNAKKRPTPPLEEHPLVVHYGLPLEHLTLTRAHRGVEGAHREAAWEGVLEHVSAGARHRVVEAMRTCLASWLGFRESVASACGLERSADGSPRLRPDAIRAS